jgi:hypothetical protein
MFGIVSTISSLEQIFKSDSKWKDIILASDTQIYAFKNKPIDEQYTSLLSQSGRLFIDDEIEAFPSVELLRKYSCSAFLMDMDPEEAMLIQEQYGVICQSVSELDDQIITSVDPDHFELMFQDNDYSWSRILSGLTEPRIPSNCLIVNDRYLFANDKLEEGCRTPGLDNLESIINILLPQTFNDNPEGVDYFPYQVLITYQVDYEKYKFTKEQLDERYKRLASKVNKLKKSINRPYKITFELIGLDSDNCFFTETHNRRIYSNYFAICCDHKIAAFNFNSSACSQTIEILKLYSKLHKEKSDQPVKGHNAFLSKYTHSIKRWMDVSRISTYKFSKNGNCKQVIHSIENRLVTPKNSINVR